jgi:hypothetical protein
MKTVSIWFGAMFFGFIGGIAGARFNNRHTISAELLSPTRGHQFELLDSSDRVASVWTTDQWGRPLLTFNDAKWEGRIVIGPISQTDMPTDKSPDSNDVWGISVTAPQHAAHATLGTGFDMNTRKPSGFANWR